MTIGHRSLAAALTALALGALTTACGTVHAHSSAGSAPSPAASATMGSGATATCPAHRPAKPASDAAGTSRSLEPLAADQVLLCGYDGPLNSPHPAALAGHLLVTDTRIVGALRAGFNGLGAVPKGRYSCPNDSGAIVVAVFSDGVHEVQLFDKVSGCPTVTNGSLTRWVGGSRVNTTVQDLLHAS